MKIQALLLSAALMIPMTAGAQTGKLVPKMATPDNAGNSNNNSQLSKKDKLFLHAIASEDQSEIDLAHLALRKSSNPQIQHYARTRILAADPAMEAGAKSVAQRNSATISSQPSAAAQQKYKDFSKLSGKQFDRAYVRYEGKKQSADLKVVQHEANTTKNAQVQSYAQMETTPVQQAAQSAQSLAHSLHVSTAS